MADTGGIKIEPTEYLSSLLIKMCEICCRACSLNDLFEFNAQLNVSRRNKQKIRNYQKKIVYVGVTRTICG